MADKPLMAIGLFVMFIGSIAAYGMGQSVATSCLRTGQGYVCNFIQVPSISNGVIVGLMGFLTLLIGARSKANG
jgi:hypothetical protein